MLSHFFDCRLFTEPAASPGCAYAELHFPSKPFVPITRLPKNLSEARRISPKPQAPTQRTTGARRTFRKASSPHTENKQRSGPALGRQCQPRPKQAGCLSLATDYATSRLNNPRNQQSRCSLRLPGSFPTAAPFFALSKNKCFGSAASPASIDGTGCSRGRLTVTTASPHTGQPVAASPPPKRFEFKASQELRTTNTYIIPNLCCSCK